MNRHDDTPAGGMNPGEAGDLLREAAAVWPIVRYDQQTALVWARALGELTFAQAQAGLRAHMRSSKEIPTPAAVTAAFRGLGTNRTGDPGNVPGGPRSKPSCGECRGGWIECPPILRRDYARDRETGEPIPGAEPTVTRYPEVVRPCSRCNPETHQKWSTGQYASEARR